MDAWAVVVAVGCAVLATAAVIALVRPGRVRAMLTRGAAPPLDIDKKPWHHGLRGLAWLLLTGAVAGLVGSLWPDRQLAPLLAAWTATVALVVLGVWFVAAMAIRADHQARVLAQRRAERGLDSPISASWRRKQLRDVPGYGGEVALLIVTVVALGIAAAQLAP